MSKRFLGAVALAVLAAGGLRADDKTTCVGGGEHETVVAACGRLIADQKVSTEDKVVAYANIGLAHRRRNEFAKAAEQFTKAIELNPKMSALYFNRGVMRYALDDMDAAVADFSEAIRLDPKDLQPYVNRAIVQFEGNHYAPAIADMDAAIKLAPSTAMLFTYRGKIHLAAGNAEKAAADFKQVLKLDPANAEAKAMLSDLGL